MPKAYSQDLREKAIAAVDRGIPKSEVIAMFTISRDSLDRWLKRREATGSLTAAQGYQRGHSIALRTGKRFESLPKCMETKPKLRWRNFGRFRSVPALCPVP